MWPSLYSVNPMYLQQPRFEHACEEHPAQMQPRFEHACEEHPAQMQHLSRESLIEKHL